MWVCDETDLILCTNDDLCGGGGGDDDNNVSLKNLYSASCFSLIASWKVGK